MLKRKKARLMLIMVCMVIIGFSGIIYAEVKIVDNGDPDATSSGTWVKSSGANPYGSESLYAPTTEETASYTWCYKVSSVPDDIDIDIWWTWWGNRCNNVPWTVYIQGNPNVPLATSGGGLNGIDQTDPNAAGQWNDLVTIPAYSTKSLDTICLQITHSINSTCANEKTTCADAVRFSNPPAVGGDCAQIKTDLEQLKNDLQTIINSIP